MEDLWYQKRYFLKLMRWRLFELLKPRNQVSLNFSQVYWHFRWVEYSLLITFFGLLDILKQLKKLLIVFEIISQAFKLNFLELTGPELSFLFVGFKESRYFGSKVVEVLLKMLLLRVEWWLLLFLFFLRLDYECGIEQILRQVLWFYWRYWRLIWDLWLLFVTCRFRLYLWLIWYVLLKQLLLLLSDFL